MTMVFHPCAGWSRQPSLTEPQRLTSRVPPGAPPGLAVDPSQPMPGCPPLDDEHRGLLVEAGVRNRHGSGHRPVPRSARPGPPGRRSSPSPAIAPRSSRLAQPWRCVRRTADPGADPRPGTLERGAEHQIAVLEARPDPGDPWRPSARNVAIVLCRCASNTVRASRTPPPPVRHPTPSPSHDHIGPGLGQQPRVFNPAGTARQRACHHESVREAECQLCAPSATVN